jgi:tripartite ATP-independent transporter DctP family solute receptor
MLNELSKLTASTKGPRRVLKMAAILIAGPIVLAWASAATAYNGPEMTLRFATIKSKTVSQGRQWNDFAERVAKATDGKVKVRVFYDGSLFGERVAIEAVLNGSVDLGTSANAQFAPWTDAMLWMDMPFVVNDQAGLRKLLDGEPGNVIRQSLEKKPGLKVLMMVDNGGGRPVLTVKKQVKTPADLKGMKVRSVSSPVDQAIWRAWGASPSPIDFAEVYSALQSGVIDGYGPNWADAIFTKQIEQIKYAVDVNYVVGTQLLVMRLDKFNALPKQLQDILLKAGHDAEQWGIKVDADEVAQVQDTYRNTYHVTIYKPTAQELDEWKRLARAVWTQFPDRVSTTQLLELQKMSGSQ